MPVELEPEVEHQVLGAERLELADLLDRLVRVPRDELTLEVVDRLEAARRWLHGELRLVRPGEEPRDVDVLERFLARVVDSSADHRHGRHGP
ncbi:MAG: hypothetical protein M3424_09240, partial [Actinomycetota bacterium]|nr:hypothetical protein [Actinomycetota bacterium]